MSLLCTVSVTDLQCMHSKYRYPTLFLVPHAYYRMFHNQGKFYILMCEKHYTYEERHADVKYN